MNEHYVTAATATGMGLLLACRCGWVKFLIAGNPELPWREHLTAWAVTDE